MNGRRWTPAEDKRLAYLWGGSALGIIARRLGRSPGAIRWRGLVALRLGSPNRGLMTLRSAARRAGYDVETLRSAARRAGVVLSRAPGSVCAGGRPRRSTQWGIEQEQLDAICDELLGREAV